MAKYKVKCPYDNTVTTFDTAYVDLPAGWVRQNLGPTYFGETTIAHDAGDFPNDPTQIVDESKVVVEFDELPEFTPYVPP